MTRKIFDGKVLDFDRSELIEVAKPLFYGYVFLAGVEILSSTTSYVPVHVGTLLGMSGLASLAFVSAALAEGVEDDWKSLLDLISITSLLSAVLFGTYIAFRFSMVN